MHTLAVGPAQGTLLLRTGVEGRAARMGHALTLVVTAWECRTEVDGDLPLAVELRAQLPSLEVVQGDGGARPLSDKDRRSIRTNALKALNADRHPQVLFTSTAVQTSPTGWSLFGDLTINGVTIPLAVDVLVKEVDGGRRITAKAAVVQSDHRITPYSTMLGALQVSDRIAVDLDVVVPLP